MNCLLSILSLCLLNPEYTEISADLSSQVAGEYIHVFGGRVYANPTVGQIQLVAGGDLTRNIQIYYGLRHRSLVAVNDRGEESVFVGLTWRPFP